MVELSGSFVMFKIFLWATEFEFILSDILTDVLGFAGRGWGNVSVLNENLCITVLTGGLGFRLAGGGNPDNSPAFLEFTVSLTFAGAVVNGSELALKLLLSARFFLGGFKIRTGVQIICPICHNSFKSFNLSKHKETLAVGSR